MKLITKFHSNYRKIKWQRGEKFKISAGTIRCHCIPRSTHLLSHLGQQSSLLGSATTDTKVFYTYKSTAQYQPIRYPDNVQHVAFNDGQRTARMTSRTYLLFIIRIQLFTLLQKRGARRESKINYEGPVEWSTTTKSLRSLPSRGGV